MNVDRKLIRSGSLDDYFAAVYHQENEWIDSEIGFLESGGQGRIGGTSRWNHFRDILNDLDRQFGVGKEDPRVYSIAGFKRERKLLDDAWETSWPGMGMWCMPRMDSEEFLPFRRDKYRYECRTTDLNARHFGRLFSEQEGRPENLTSLRLIWGYIHRSALVMLHFVNDPKLRLPRKTAADNKLDVEVLTVYSSLHRLAIPWAPSPPYAPMSSLESADKLIEISHKLEAMEAAAANTTYRPNSKSGAGRRSVYGDFDTRTLVANWLAAKAKGSTKKDFCKSRGIPLKTLSRAQSRLRKQKVKRTDARSSSK